MTNHYLTKKVSKGSLFSWALYDWANSAHSSVIMTFVFATYFTAAVAKNKILGTAQWGTTIAIAGIIVALLSPVLGAIADHKGCRKPWLLSFTLILFISTALLWYIRPSPSYVLWALSLIVISTIGFEIAMVFYNAMLSDIAPKNYVGRLSGWGWGLGYVGGVICLSIVLFGFVKGGFTFFHLDRQQAEQIRIAGPLVAVWLAVFSWPLFVFTPDRQRTGIKSSSAVKQGLRSLINTLQSLKNYREILKFLLARMFYTDGLNTIFAFGGIYAANTFHMSFAQVIEFGISLNIGAGIGAAIFAFIDDFRGSKFTVLLALFIMLLSGTGMLFVHSQVWFWSLGLILSLTVGPIQASSRSLMVRLAPKKIATEMFGLYAFSGKVTAFIGPYVLGWITFLFASQRVGMVTPLILLIIGGIILLFVKEH